MADDCPFCGLRRDQLVDENEFAAALPDAYPVAAGHTLVVPKRHVASLFDLPQGEQEALHDLLATRPSI